MKVRVLNLYNDIAPKKSGLIADHGQSFLISINKKNILFDTGSNGKYLLDNMKKLHVDPAEIDTVILSHGHYDHTGGIKALVETQPNNKSLTIIAHNYALIPKGGKKQEDDKVSIIEIGFPILSEEIKNRITYILVKESYQVTSYLYTLGEITDRPYKEGISANHMFWSNDTWQPDIMIDDLSIVLKTKKGLVLICGCCHAGLLNTLLKVSNLFPKENIHAIMGGTHMLEFNGEEVNFIAKELREKYNTPRLYLNHCTGLNTTELLSEIFGENILGECLVGASFKFEL
ncbi:MAG: MBL fold metallo-hydrolase [Candidatus Heimdallarchaeota archaeon]|nr:MBL fold metallo-hydrolase [Candidatus Heimdallarchaeota archaeon]